MCIYRQCCFKNGMKNQFFFILCSFLVHLLAQRLMYPKTSFFKKFLILIAIKTFFIYIFISILYSFKEENYIPLMATIRYSSQKNIFFFHRNIIVDPCPPLATLHRFA